MAYLIPSDLSQLHLSDPHNPEIRVLHMLKQKLPNDYMVFHGVHWSREYAEWTHFGEIDFVILNQSGKVLLIEQKNGKLEETDEGLVKRYAKGEKNAVQQIHRSIDKVREKFKRQKNSQRPLEVDYLIYCPDHKVVKVNAAGVDMQRIVDARSKNQLAKRIQEVLQKGEKPADGQYQKVRDFFHQTFDLVPDIHSHIESQETRFKQHIGDHAKILMNLEMTPFRLKISGTAGSGKSQFARQFFDRELANNRKILLLCYNRPLSDQLKTSIGTAGKVNTFLGFCDEFVQSVGERLNYNEIKSNPRFWKDVTDRISNFEIADEWQYDSLIVDEGQDFEQEWYEIIRLFVHDEANILWLEDSDQNLYRKPPIEHKGFVGYRYPVNYRSPESIASFIQQTLPFDFEIGNSLPGLEVVTHAYCLEEEQPDIVSKIVIELMRKGFSKQQIIVLSCRGLAKSIFYRRDQIGDLSLHKFTSKYDDHGEQIWTEGDLKFDSIFRYKGLEMPAVILVDVDPDEYQLDNFDTVLYCGMTRATVRLEMVVQKHNPYNSRFLDCKP